jgi:hypothetical protein
MKNIYIMRMLKITQKEDQEKYEVLGIKIKLK